MIAEVFANSLSENIGRTNSSGIGRGDVLLTVSLIPVFRVSTVAGQADPLACLADQRTEWELGERLGFLADATSTQTEGCVE